MNCQRWSFSKPRFLWSLAGLFLGFRTLTGCSPGEDAAAPAAAVAAAADTSAAKDLAEGRAVRAVWLEETAAGDAPMARQLFVLSTAESGGGGGAPRRLGAEAGDLARPLITPDGQAVVLTRLGLTKTENGFAFAPRMLWQPWDGSPAKPLGAGMAAELWKNPADGATYIYAVRTLQPSAAAPLRLTGEILVRFRADQPENQEILWSATPLNAEQFQLSRDGRRAAGAFPFPKTGLANLEDQTFTPLSPGAWAALASDDSYASAVLDGSRRRLRCLAPNLNPGWELTLAGADGWPEGGILHPRWSNDPRVLTFTGPYPEEAPAADVWLLRLRDDLRRIEKTARLTQGRKALSPAVWIENGGARPSALPQEPVEVPKPVPKPWPVTEDGLVFAWESARPGRAAPLPMAPASLNPGGFATFGRHFEMNLSGGWYEADDAAAARTAQACAASNAWSMELMLTERTTQPPVSVRLAALMRADGREEFALYRVDRKLVLRVLLGGTPERPEAVHPVILTNLAIEGDRPVHVLITLRNNRLSCRVDGQVMKDFELESSGLAAWGPGKLIFGDARPYGTAWTGWMERIAIYSRALGDDEGRAAAAAAAQWIEGRTRPARSKVQARLVENPEPAPAGAAGDEMTLSIWEVEQVFMGQVGEKRIAAGQWSRLRGVPVPVPAIETGKGAELWLESWEDHPELENAPLRSSPQAAALPRYFLARPLAPPPAAPGS